MIDQSPQEIEALSKSFEEKTPQDILHWAVATFCPDVAMSSSFQTQSVPLLHMISQIRPQMRVFFVDTGFHFWDTLMFREKLERLWQFNVVDLRPDGSWRIFLRQFGRDLYEHDPDLCCYIRKVQPMQQAMQGIKAWITGIRRDQTAHRAQAKILELQENGLLKINPMLNWTKQDIWKYIRENNLPEHPMLEKGYTSIGCTPCTRPVLPGEDERSGRWTGKNKTECGLHTELFSHKGLNPAELIKYFDPEKPIDDGE